MQLTTKNLIFSINEQAGEAAFLLPQKPEKAVQGADFWRIVLDDGARTEIAVRSAKQTGRVTKTENGVVIEYDQLLSDYGEIYPISFRVEVVQEGELIRFTPTISNHDEKVRVNECFCPMVTFEELCGDNKEEDVAFIPIDLGMKFDNPWEYLRKKTGDYYGHDEEEVRWFLKYPGASMPWFGVQSGGKFFYIARYDENFRMFIMSMRQTIHHEPLNIMFNIDHFPMLRPGETLALPSSVVGMLDGDWRSGADVYRAWADKTFYRVPKKADWVRNMTGFQRIIMRSMYGEDYYKAEDLPAMYEAGAKYGVHALFLFAWWKEGMDRGYPEYNEPYPGAYKALRENIQKVREMGGRVILECNSNFIDPCTDYYKKYGDEVVLRNVYGNEERRLWGIGGLTYPGMGDFQLVDGPKILLSTCSGSKRWREQMQQQVELMATMEPDCIFLDCYGWLPEAACFNEQHDHGPRVDEELMYRRMVFDRAEKYCDQVGAVLGTEHHMDLTSSYTQFTHGNLDMCPAASSSVYPALFRYTFPEIIGTCRSIRHADGPYIKQFKWNLTMGMRLDAELHVCRATIDKEPAYAAAVAQYAQKLNEYGDFLMRGKFTVQDNSPIPDDIKRGEYISEDGTKVLRILYNIADEPLQAGEVLLQGDEMRFDIFNAEEYCAKFER